MVKKTISLSQSKHWLQRASRVIPGCSQTFSKGPSQYVQGISPIFLQKGKGCRVWDVDGNEFIDYVQGLLPNILGYAHEEVNRAFFDQVAQGHSFSLPHPLEVQLAEKLVEIIPCAEMVRFGKNGSDATAGAVRIARAYTGKERVACCGYHGWQDWYIGSTPRHLGVPNQVRELTHTFSYNNIQSLEAVLQKHPGEFACIILEPVNFTPPQEGFLEGVQQLARKHGCVLVFDEICSGFHLGLGGAQKKFGVIPDLACFGKAMGNGFPVSCVVGKAEIMKICTEIFFSFTFGGEVASMAAALKVIQILETTEALQTMESHGKILQNAFNQFAAAHHLSQRMICSGYPSWSLIRFLDADGKDDLILRSLWQQEVIQRGILQLVTHNMTAAHDQTAIDSTLSAYEEAFDKIAEYLSDPDPSRHLLGDPIQPVFKVR